MSNEHEFKITTDVFEGPLDLLLSLIEKRKLLINDIALAKVTDDFIAHVKELEQFSLHRTSHFVLIASTLLLIKSKSLLPTLELSEEEQSDISDLELRLKLYKAYKEAALHIETRFGAATMFDRQEVRAKNQPAVFAPSKQMTVAGFRDAMFAVLKSLPKVEKIPEAIIKKVISLEEMIGRLTGRIQNSLRMSFREFAGADSKAAKVDVIVSFLAMLELVRQDVLKVEQESKYSDIQMETNAISTPQYS